MTCLHTVNKSHFSTSMVTNALERINAGDSVLFIEDGAYNTIMNSPIAGVIQQMAQQNVTFYVVENDLAARGLSGDLLASIKPVDYSGFVKLSTQHDSIISWY